MAAGLPSGQLLDTGLNTTTADQTAYELKEILAALGLKPTMHNFEVVAHDLSRLARKTSPWTKKYIHSVYRERIEASPLLARTISALAQVADGTPKGVAGTVYVKVLAQPDIPEGVLIPANAKVVKCARPGCPVMFVKVHPRQRYHDASCR
jgi:hypothetical protein